MENGWESAVAKDSEAIATPVRAFEYKAVLKKATHRRLTWFLEQQRQLCNAGLQERTDCYQKTEDAKPISIGKFEQFKSLTELRRGLPEFSQYHVGVPEGRTDPPGQTLQEVLQVEETELWEELVTHAGLSLGIACAFPLQSCKGYGTFTPAELQRKR